MRVVKTIATRIVNDLRLVKFLKMGRDDVQEKKQVSPYGIDSNPVEDMVAIYAPTLQDGEEFVIGYINKNQIADIGEFRIFSTDQNGDVQIAFHLKNDGTAELGGDADNAVRYSKLKTAFDQLKQDHNDLVNAFNAHTHTAPSGATSPPVPTPPLIPASVSTADIGPAKIDELKVS